MNERYAQMGEHLLAGRAEELKRAVEEAIEAGALPEQILGEAVMPAMEALGDRFSRGEAYLPELLLAAHTMQAAMKALGPAKDGGGGRQGKMLIGTVEGDIHDLGKNLVKMMFEGAGFAVVDAGINVAAEKFREAYEREKPDLLGLSSLLTTTMVEMEKVIRKVRGEHPDARIIVGGAPINQDFADKVGADGYAPDAPSAVKVGKTILGL